MLPRFGPGLGCRLMLKARFRAFHLAVSRLAALAICTGVLGWGENGGLGTVGRGRSNGLVAFWVQGRDLVWRSGGDDADDEVSRSRLLPHGMYIMQHDY